MRLTLLKGWDVAAGWAVDVLELSASGRARHEQLTTTTVQVPGQEEPRIVKRDIPASFSALVEKAGQDKNHLQKTVNVHESALTWIDNYEKCNSKSEQRRLVRMRLCCPRWVYISNANNFSGFIAYSSLEGSMDSRQCSASF